ncbi:hypothetical protein HK104_003707 [Borealophlyctis nickersoniae]|nr:hypothetical protein HK104_003707 [Borealophlyctis nickersoniae]
MFRLNFSHITDPETQTPVINTIRKESADLGLPVAILGDLGGPKVRCGTFSPNPTITLKTGTSVRLRISSEPGTDGLITTEVATIVKQLEPGHRVLLDDGNLCLRVTNRISQEELELQVITGGILKSHKGINVPDIKLDVPALTEKDKSDARYMYKMRLEYVALSFVQKPEDVTDLHRWFDQCKEEAPAQRPPESEHEPDEIEEGWRPHIILKIEKPQALDDIDALIEVGDGIMVARGDLGVEVSLERVPIIQKMLIMKTNAADKPVITATQMLESMINSPMPTRAEVSDVANAVLDGTDAVMLSAECATGEFPVETVKMMSSICQTAEAGEMYGIGAPDIRPQVRSMQGKREFSHAIADAAVAAAEEANASALIVITATGEIAHYVSKRRPNRPIVAITATYSVWRRLALVYGVFPIVTNSMKARIPKSATSPVSDEAAAKRISPTTPTNSGPPSPTKLTFSAPTGFITNTDQIYATTETDILRSALNAHLGIATGDKVVFCAGYHLPWPGLSNTVKMARFGDAGRVLRVRGRWYDAAGSLKKKAGSGDSGRDTPAPG